MPTLRGTRFSARHSSEAEPTSNLAGVDRPCYWTLVHWSGVRSEKTKQERPIASIAAALGASNEFGTSDFSDARVSGAEPEKATIAGGPQGHRESDEGLLGASAGAGPS